MYRTDSKVSLGGTRRVYNPNRTSETPEIKPMAHNTTNVFAHYSPIAVDSNKV